MGLCHSGVDLVTDLTHSFPARHSNSVIQLVSQSVRMNESSKNQASNPETNTEQSVHSSSVRAVIHLSKQVRPADGLTD